MEYLQSWVGNLGSSQRLLLVLAVAAAAHGVVLLIRRLTSYWMGLSVKQSRRKAVSLLSLFSSSLIFIFYFAAIGFVLSEFGVPIAAYLASASIIGLAVGFGSQGLVQDVVSGLTSIFSDIYDIGDMVEISGQVGVVTRIGLRFLEIENPRVGGSIPPLGTIFTIYISYL
jgi:moderate conductance mechanosensitive channel